MAAIDGLTEEQCELLANVKVDDFVLITAYAKPTQNNRDGQQVKEKGRDVVEDGDDVDGGVEQDDQQDGDQGEGQMENPGNEGNNNDSDEKYFAPTYHLYFVEKVTKGNDNTITNIRLYRLKYDAKPSEVEEPSFQIYGRCVVATFPAFPVADDFDEDYAYDLKDIVKDEAKEYHILLEPDGDQIRDEIFGYQCPGGCDDGWLSSLKEYQDLVDGIIPNVEEYRPVCPVCIGKDYAWSLHNLRMELDANHRVELGRVVDFYHTLSPRRQRLAYDFTQFDERQWGYMFDDMLSESEDGDDRDDGDWERWDEALDPSSGILFTPAKEDAIASLPRKLYGEVRKVDVDEEECLVCREKFEEEAMVAVLPCGHYFCNTGCIDWLKQSNSCPTCRAKLPSADEDEGEAGRNGGENGLGFVADTADSEGRRDDEESTEEDYGEVESGDESSEDEYESAEGEVEKSDENDGKDDEDVVMQDT